MKDKKNTSFAIHWSYEPTYNHTKYSTVFSSSFLTIFGININAIHRHIGYMICETASNFVFFSFSLSIQRTNKKANRAHWGGYEVGNQAVMNGYLGLFNKKNIYLYYHIVKACNKIVWLNDWNKGESGDFKMPRRMSTIVDDFAVPAIEWTICGKKNDVHDYFDAPWIMLKHHEVLQFPIKMQTNKATHLVRQFYKILLAFNKQRKNS